MIDGSLSALRIFHKLGARYLTLTHWDNVEWADAATDRAEHDGLTEFGEAVVREMNRLGMFVDISHVSRPTPCATCCACAGRPVIFSHSNAVRHRPPSAQCTGRRAGGCAGNGGVIHVNFIKEFVSPKGAAWQRRATRRSARLHARLDDQKAIKEAASPAWEKANPHPRGTIAEVVDHIDHIRKVAGIDHVGIGADYYDAQATPWSPDSRT